MTASESAQRNQRSGCAGSDISAAGVIGSRTRARRFSNGSVLVLAIINGIESTIAMAPAMRLRSARRPRDGSSGSWTCSRVAGGRVMLRSGHGGVVARVTNGFDQRLDLERLRGVDLRGVGEQADRRGLNARDGAQRALDVVLARSAAHAGDLEGLFSHAQGCSVMGHQRNTCAG